MLNARGMDLLPSDLIKSFFMSKLKDDKTRQFVSDWQKLEDIVKETDLELDDLFTLYEYYALASNPKKSLNDEIQQIFLNVDSNKAITELRNFAILYKEQIYDKYEKTVNALWYLRWAMYWKMILLTALQNKYNDYSKLTVLLRRYYYLYWMAGKTLTQIKQTSFNVVKWVKAKKPASFIEKELNKKLKEDGIEALVLNNLKGEVYFEAWVKPLFLMIEYNQIEENNNYIEWDNKLHIEHVLPVGYSTIKGWNHIDEETAKKYLHSIGNLTLLSGSKNIEASNNSFKDKLSIYKGKGKYNDKKEGITAFHITQNILNDYNQRKIKQWDEISIVNRWNWVCEEVAEILGINTKSIKLSISKK
ncbi:MAG: HNH endonuclease [Oligoflexia bacterium]|nr:HNH endonuclease [Oligoflexia bacterium]